MGYYSGNGIVTGGGESIRPLSHISFINASGGLAYLFAEQKEKRTTTTHPGVSLSTAQSQGSTSGLVEEAINYDTGVVRLWLIPSCKGVATNVRHSQINGSNLYNLEIEETHLWARRRYNREAWTNWSDS